MLNCPERICMDHLMSYRLRVSPLAVRFHDNKAGGWAHCWQIPSTVLADATPSWQTQTHTYTHTHTHTQAAESHLFMKSGCSTHPISCFSMQMCRRKKPHSVFFKFYNNNNSGKYIWTRYIANIIQHTLEHIWVGDGFWTKKQIIILSFLSSDENYSREISMRKHREGRS